MELHVKFEFRLCWDYYILYYMNPTRGGFLVDIKYKIMSENI